MTVNYIGEIGIKFRGYHNTSGIRSYGVLGAFGEGSIETGNYQISEIGNVKEGRIGSLEIMTSRILNGQCNLGIGEGSYYFWALSRGISGFGTIIRFVESSWFPHTFAGRFEFSRYYVSSVWNNFGEGRIHEWGKC